MSTLNPNLLSKGMTEAMNAAVPVMRALNKRLLTPEVLLLTFIRLPDCTAGRLLQRTADSRGFKLADLEREVENQGALHRRPPRRFRFCHIQRRQG